MSDLKDLEARIQELEKTVQGILAIVKDLITVLEAHQESLRLLSSNKND